MHAQTVAEEDPSPSLIPPIRPEMPWRVASVRPLPHRRLNVAFRDGLTGTVDLSGLVASRSAGVFAALRDDEAFTRVTIVHGAATWPGDLDLAPYAMHRAIAEHGEGVPT